MIDIKTFDCTGCFACYNVCTNNAITMTENEEGFKFPKIDQYKCSNCGLCERVCIIKKDNISNSFTQKAFGAKNKDLIERKQSQSGGVFYVLAKHVLSQGGVVYGAIIDDDFVVKHFRANSLESAQKIRGSKYVQSDLGKNFISVKEDLKCGKKVLFSGTPCQIAGLKNYLNKQYDNLILVDLICHGVPTPKLVKDYINWQEKRLKTSIDKIQFRDTELSWGQNSESLYFKGKKKTFGIYSKLFLSNNALRESCYTCKFASTKKLSDITIGDFWGIEAVNKNFKDKKGVSSVIINSTCGEKLWQEVSESLEIFSCEVGDITKSNKNLVRPTLKPKSRTEFWEDYQKGFGFIAKKYGGNNIKGKSKRIIKKFLGKI